LNLESTKALLPATYFRAALSPIDRIEVSLGHYPSHSREPIEATVYTLDGIEGIYGPDGQKRMQTKGSEFVNTYV
jgi:hypothetical protein